MSLEIDGRYLVRVLEELLAIPSPTGYTDAVVRFVCGKLEELGLPFELTRRGAIRATFAGRQSDPARAIVAHVDTLGAMVKNLKPNGRLEVVPIGHWSSRFAEGARVTIFTDTAAYRGTILPLKASGHTFNTEIDTQPVAWTNVEVRVDETIEDLEGLRRAGFNVGDFIAVDPQPEFNDNGYINARHLDNKAGVALLLAAAKAVKETGEAPPVDCHLLFTISEEVGSGASAVLHGHVAEMVSIDNATPAPGQNSSTHGVTIAMMDSSGPFDYHLTHKLIGLCKRHGLDHCRDVFRYYRCDAASALEAGNDLRTALVCFAADASHGNERTHRRSLETASRLIALYMQSRPTFQRDKEELSSDVESFPMQPPWSEEASP